MQDSGSWDTVQDPTDLSVVPQSFWALLEMFTNPSEVTSHGSTPRTDYSSASPSANTPPPA